MSPGFISYRVLAQMTVISFSEAAMNYLIMSKYVTLSNLISSIKLANVSDFYTKCSACPKVAVTDMCEFMAFCNNYVWGWSDAGLGKRIHKRGHPWT